MFNWKLPLRLVLVVAAMATSVISEAQLSDDTVVIGVLSDQSSIYSDTSGPGSTIAAQMAVDDFGNTVLGKAIRVINANHQLKPEVAITIARKWIDAERVDAIADVNSSAIALAVQHVTREKNRVLLNSGSTSSDLSGKACSPTAVQWTWTTHALAIGAARAAKKGSSWYVVGANYAFSEAMVRDATRFIEADKGKIIGTVKHPLNTSDFGSFLLQAQNSGAEVIGLANAGGDTVNALKQAREFGLLGGDKQVIAFLLGLHDVHSLGLEAAQGVHATVSFYWDISNDTRAWAKRFMQLSGGKPPSEIHAGTYSAVLHYLTAVKAAGTDDAATVTRKMRDLPVEDFYTHGAQLREDGLLLRDYYHVRVKAPAELRYPFDYFALVETIPATVAAWPLAEGNCPMVLTK